MQVRDAVPLSYNCAYRYVLFYSMHSAAYIPSSDWVKPYEKIGGGEAQSMVQFLQPKKHKNL
jgi:hypothetical protein